MSLRDELTQVLRQHYGSLWCPTCHPAGRRDWDTPWDVVAHQADAVIAHLALTEEWESRGLGIGPQWSPTNNARSAAYLAEKWGHETRRRYVTPWENTHG